MEKSLDPRKAHYAAAETLSYPGASRDGKGLESGLPRPLQKVYRDGWELAYAFMDLSRIGIAWAGAAERAHGAPRLGGLAAELLVRAVLDLARSGHGVGH